MLTLLSTYARLPTGNVVEKTFRAGEMVNSADISKREGQFTYAEGDTYVFMVSRQRGPCAADGEMPLQGALPRGGAWYVAGPGTRPTIPPP